MYQNFISMKKIIFILSLFILASCSKDDDSQAVDQLFLSNNVGFWETTFNDLGVNVAVEITPTKAKSYSKLISDNCYTSSNVQLSGDLNVDKHTATEYSSVLSNVSVEEIFSGDDLDYLISEGINFIDIASSYASSGNNYISFAEIYYEAGTLYEVLNVSGNLGKVNSIVKC